MTGSAIWHIAYLTQQYSNISPCIWCPTDVTMVGSNKVAQILWQLYVVCVLLHWLLKLHPLQLENLEFQIRTMHFYHHHWFQGTPWGMLLALLHAAATASSGVLMTDCLLSLRLNYASYAMGPTKVFFVFESSAFDFLCWCYCVCFLCSGSDIMIYTGRSPTSWIYTATTILQKILMAGIFLPSDVGFWPVCKNNGSIWPFCMLAVWLAFVVVMFVHTCQIYVGVTLGEATWLWY